MVYLQDSIILLGDSITQGGYDLNGFAARLAHVYNRKMDVINRGFSGYNAPWSLVAFKKFWPTREHQIHLPPVRLLVIWFGANDSCLPSKAQHVPLPNFSSTLSSFISLVRSPTSDYYSPHTRVILITPPPFNPIQRGAELMARNPPGEMDRDFDVTKNYADAVKEVGKKENVPVVDCWTDLWEAAGKEQERLAEFLSDGLHLTGKGYEIVYNGLMKVVKSDFPEISPENLEQLFPAWDQVDPKDPEPSLQTRNVMKTL